MNMRFIILYGNRMRITMRILIFKKVSFIGHPFYTLSQDYLKIFQIEMGSYSSTCLCATHWTKDILL